MNDTQEPHEHVFETNDETFDRDVFERSKTVPVVVDFWAAWCQPCRMLTPLLVELAQRHEGRFVLVKANTDEAPRAAASFNVQAIPAVYGVIDGQIVDFFQGVLPADQLDSWLERFLLVGRVSELRRLEESDPAKAAEGYREYLVQSPNDSTAAVGLARALLAQEQYDESRKLLEELEQRGFLEPEAQKIKAALDLKQWSKQDVTASRAAFETAPDDPELQLALARALAAEESYEQALENCLEIISRHKDQKETSESARQLMVDIFLVLPDDSELVHTYRRKLSLALY
jgi:putative thioredoxin